MSLLRNYVLCGWEMWGLRGFDLGYEEGFKTLFLLELGAGEGEDSRSTAKSSMIILPAKGLMITHLYARVYKREGYGSEELGMEM